MKTASSTCDSCAIRDLLGRSIVISDMGDLADFSQIYRDDAIWTSASARREGLAAIIAGTQAFRDRGGSGPGSRSIHLLLPLTVTVNGDEAQAISHFALVNAKADPPAMTPIGTYTDSLARTPDGWRITRRHMVLL